ncbi:ParA family protein [Fodinicola feengrottensis]|uniref:ParA family protein n=1 Tax=Fodinicola feengrottensis TaxID=435914 RepID=A0ABP4SW77_9ACTN
MLTLAVLSLKGGVGKTTVVLGLAGAALQRGLRTLVVDLDPQANATFALEPAETSYTVADVLLGGRNQLAGAVAPSGWGPALEVLVGSDGTEAANAPDPSARKLSRLRTALSTVDGKDGYDLVLLDCPPSLGQLTRGALVAAQRAMLVTDPSVFAVAGTRRAFDAVQAERKAHNAELQPLGVLVNRFRARSAEHEYRIGELRELFGPLVLTTLLPERSAVQQAQGAAVPVQRWPTPGGREIAAAFEHLLDRVLRSSKKRPGTARATGA